MFNKYFPLFTYSAKFSLLLLDAAIDCIHSLHFESIPDKTDNKYAEYSSIHRILNPSAVIPVIHQCLWLHFTRSLRCSTLDRHRRPDARHEGRPDADPLLAPLIDSSTATMESRVNWQLCSDSFANNRLESSLP